MTEFLTTEELNSYEKLNAVRSDLNKRIDFLSETERNNAAKDGWVEEYPETKISLRNVDMVVLSVDECKTDNILTYTLLCVNGDTKFHMVRFKYEVYLSNKNMLKNKFEVGDLINMHLVKAFVTYLKRRLKLSYRDVYKLQSNEIYINKLYVKKPGRRW